jgi:aminoglycoside phosphotransferase family enzyme/predicted kinase
VPASELVTALCDRLAYPHPCRDIRLVETHISWVFLTGEFAYKLKKPVNFGFLDFSTLQKRRYFCEEECRCNSTFAPDLYLGVVAIGLDANRQYRVGSDADAIEYAVKMRQFDDSYQLDRMLDRDTLTAPMLRQFANDLAAIYQTLAPLSDSSSLGCADQILAPVIDNFDALDGLSASRLYAKNLARLRQWSMTMHEHLSDLLDERAREGAIRERHGDLHLSNLVQTDAGILAFDCIEFSPPLRKIDAINDIAFLFMDCAVRNRQDLAYSFIDSYLESSGDYPGIRLLRFYAVYRSMVRAKVAALRLEQTPDSDAAQRLKQHINWADETISAATGQVVLMCGPSGSGKSWLAKRLAPHLPAIRIRSDIVRREFAGLDRTESSSSDLDSGIYTPTMSENVYMRLLALTRGLIDSGETVIVDATFLSAKHRATFQTWAETSRCRCVVVQCEAPRDCLEQRVVDRLGARTDPSEATLEVLDQQLQGFEPPEDGEHTIRVRTDNEVDVAQLARQILTPRSVV